MLDIRTAQDDIEDALRDAVLYALGKRVAAVTSIAALRAFVTQGANGSSMHDDMLAAVTVAGVTSGYRWNQKSTASDDGAAVVKPNDVTGSGRWLRYTSPLRIAPTVGGSSYYLHELTTGPLERVLVLDKNLEEAELANLIFGQVPSVLIEATDDTPEDLTQISGHRYSKTYHFTVSIFAQNLRDRRQAAQGSTYTGEQSKGANKLDGLIQSLLGGTQLQSVLSGVRNVQIGRGYNWMSEQQMRRVIRGRAFAIQATVENPPASNDYGSAETIFAQGEMTSLGDDTETAWVDGEDHVTGGMDVSLGVGLSKNVTAGTALMNGETVTFAGQLHSFTASTLTYRDLASDGTMTYVEAGLGQAEPPVTDSCLRVGVTTTDGSGVIADRIVARRRVPYGSNNEIDLT